MRLFLIVCLVVSAVRGADRGPLVFSDAFENEGTFVENWVPQKATPHEAKVRIEEGGSLRLRVPTPHEFVAEADVTLCPAWSTREPAGPQKGWGGFSFAGSLFCIQPCGKSFMVFKPAGQTRSEGRYLALDGIAPGTCARLRLMRTRVGPGAVRDAFWVNDRLVHDFVTAAVEAREGESVRLIAWNVDLEADNFALYGIRHTDDAPNTLINSGFEYDEEGVPTYYGLQGAFDFAKWPWQRFHSDYLTRYQVDSNEKHSGRQSLRVRVNGASREIFIDPWRPGTVKDLAGVFSVWMKASEEGVRVQLSLDPTSQGGCSDGRRVVDVGRTWRRYEVTRAVLKGQGVRSPVRIRVLDPARYIDASLWLDDLQLELVDLPEGGFDPNRSYASDYKPSAADPERLGKSPEPPPCTAETRVRADTTDKVLGRLDFYMDEPFAQWRVTGDDGRVQVAQKPLAEIPPGTNRVSFALGGKNYTDTVVKLPYRKGATQVNRWTRSIVHEGRNEIFTGLGIGVAGHFGHSANADPFPGLFDLLKADGFRHFIYLSGSRSERLAESRAILEASHARGFLCGFWSDYDIWNYTDTLEHAQLKPGDDVPLEETVALSQAFDHIVTHLAIDEPELYKTSAWTKAWLEKIKAHYPYSPVQMNNSMVGIPGKFADLQTDILMLDDYLTNNEGRTVDSVVRHVDEMRSVPGGKPCWYFLVGNNLSLHYKNPSYAEQVAQSWGAICAGCTGLAWFFEMPCTAGTYRAMVDVNREVQALAPILLSEELCEEAQSNLPPSVLRHLTRKYEGAWYVFSCNIATRPTRGTFRLPSEAPYNGTVEVLFENRTLPLKEGCFADDYAGHTRHLYRIRGSVPM